MNRLEDIAEQQGIDVADSEFTPLDNVLGNLLALNWFAFKKGTFGDYAELELQNPETGETPFRVITGASQILYVLHQLESKNVSLPILVYFEKKGRKYFIR